MLDPAKQSANLQAHSLADPTATTGADTTRPGEVRPDTTNRYVLGDEIARGGMGVVYLATDTVLNRPVAVKVLQERFARTPGAVRRFDGEARITGQLQHPGIPPVHDLGTLPDGRPFLAMKLIRGRTLDGLLKECPAPSERRGRFVAVFEQICQTVAYAHDHGIIHRDLKPENVMVGDYGEVQVMDWGLAKELAGVKSSARHTPDPDATAGATEVLLPDRDDHLTQPGSIIGTPAFMPPEQARGAIDQIDERSDVFGLGGVLAALLTNSPPFQADGPENTRRLSAEGKVQYCFARLAACDADPELVALCKWCLSPERDQRPENAGRVARAVAALRQAADERARRAELDRVHSEAERRAADLQAAEQRRRSRLRLALVAAVGLLVIGAGAFAWWQDKQATRQRTDDEARRTRNADAVAALLDQTEAALRADDTRRAWSLLEQIERRTGEGGAEGHAPRIASVRVGATLLREFDRIDQARWVPVRARLPNADELDRRWRAAFASVGMTPGDVPPSEWAARLADSLVRERVLAVLDLWLIAKPTPEVRAVLTASDSDPYREAVRAAVLAHDRRRIIELAGQPPALDQPVHFAAALGQQGDIPPARRVQLLSAAVASSPGNLPLLMRLGQLTEDNLRTAAAWYQAAVAAHPTNVSALTNLGNEFIIASDLARARPYLVEAARLDPGFAHARNGLGVLKFHGGDPKGALVEYREAMRLGLSDEPGVRHNIAQALLVLADADGAIEECREAIRLGATNADVHITLANALRRKRADAQAVAVLREAAREYPADYRVHHNLGNALLAVKDTDGAVAAFKEAIRIDPGAVYPRIGLGGVLQSRKEYDAAAAEFREAIRLDPTSVTAHVFLANTLAMKGDYDAAIAAFHEALKHDPENALARKNLGTVQGMRSNRLAKEGRIAPPPREVNR